MELNALLHVPSALPLGCKYLKIRREKGNQKIEKKVIRKEKK
jgi:hypothetical protein